MTEQAPAPRKPLPIWAKIARIVAILACLFLFVAAYFVMQGGDGAAEWERLGSSAFGVAVMAVMMLFLGRAQTRK
ncbi:hypothetical protein [Tessaracoccus flavus]|jgi:peptidoglycan/LPS O-acetylase OafA/YrhL|uniref:Uncharacterized protein n=1 Tax=Tessaracoccus flavus TaxID=1610493 RepID=A0A1Q2CDT5_9ACTN|nr:hypothetical protein [Tessaracoccus flavus]AQP44266.1 hypothetical protein RPIT_05090 [Tessaracoccus flavus]SDY40020.1 hypothetical protein SAMN05428934_101624 [Tessaracoccus flavus]